MNKEKNELIIPKGIELFDRVVSILDQARVNVTHSVNSNIILAYWLIGREIIEKVQAGKGRAGYGKKVLKELSLLLMKKYDKGFSVTSLQYFRKFYQVYENRISISLPSDEKSSFQKLPQQSISSLQGFSSKLTWSHYRALMRVSNLEARNFYEIEAVECGWSKVQLERQIQTSYYERIIRNEGKEGLLSINRERLPGDILSPIHILKSPYVLEFLDLPNAAALHESDLEQAIINNLQSFLLELGKGFSFVARQKHIHFDGDDFYVDLVFYNYVLKCFLLIDLKIGKLTHRDVGQMDGYVRLFEDLFKVEGDNPTIGLILCSDKSEAVAKYSILNENKQLFASKYLDFLPSEKDLKLKIEEERRLIESTLQDTEED